VLGEVEGLFAAGEVYALSERITNGDSCGCGVALADCPFWGAVLRSAFPEGDALPRVRTERRWIHGRTLASLLLGRDRQRLRTYRDDLAKLYRAIATVSGCRVIVDSSKSPTYAYILDRTPGIELYGVHLVRDPRAVAFSWNKRVLKPEAADEEYMDAYGPFRVGTQWVVYNALFAAIRRSGTPTSFLTYEQLVADPESELRRVLGELVPELSGPLPELGGEVSLPLQHTVAGNPVRFSRGALRIALDDEWRRAMRRRDRRVVELATAPLLWRYGYVGRR
jgi:hypothetical protein